MAVIKVNIMFLHVPLRYHRNTLAELKIFRSFYVKQEY
jgi:hypothetical protein